MVRVTGSRHPTLLNVDRPGTGKSQKVKNFVMRGWLSNKVNNSKTLITIRLSILAEKPALSFSR